MIPVKSNQEKTGEAQIVQNLQIINLYYALIATQKLLQNELLPVAGHLGMENAAPELFETAEAFCEALTRHLENNKIQISPNGEFNV